MKKGRVITLVYSSELGSTWTLGKQTVRNGDEVCCHVRHRMPSKNPCTISSYVCLIAATREVRLAMGTICSWGMWFGHDPTAFSKLQSGTLACGRARSISWNIAHCCGALQRTGGGAVRRREWLPFASKIRQHTRAYHLTMTELVLSLFARMPPPQRVIHAIRGGRSVRWCFFTTFETTGTICAAEHRSGAEPR